MQVRKGQNITTSDMVAVRFSWLILFFPHFLHDVYPLSSLERRLLAGAERSGRSSGIRQSCLWNLLHDLHYVVPCTSSHAVTPHLQPCVSGQVFWYHCIMKGGAR